MHLVADRKGRPLGMVVTAGNVNDTMMFAATLDDIRVPRERGRARSRPDRVLADRGHPSRADRAWLRARGIAATIPERADQIKHRSKRAGRLIEFGGEQQRRFRGRNVVERCFNKLKLWRGIAMRFEKLARNSRVGVTLASILIWLTTELLNTALGAQRCIVCRDPLGVAHRARRGAVTEG